MSDGALRYLARTMRLREFQALLGTTMSTYEAWAKKNNVTPIVDEIGEGGRFIWLGPKHTDRVIMYVHGKITY